MSWLKSKLLQWIIKLNEENSIEIEAEKDFVRFDKCLSQIEFAKNRSQIDEFEKFGPDRLRLMVFGEDYYFDSNNKLISDAFEGLVEK